MATFASTFVLKLEIPYSEFWIPLLIGMGVGVVALTACKLVGGRKKPALAGSSKTKRPSPIRIMTLLRREAPASSVNRFADRGIPCRSMWLSRIAKTHDVGGRGGPIRGAGCACT